jgi:DHA2 family multidrug resistance protein
MMPFVGRMIQRIPQSYMVGGGFLSFFIFTFMMHNVMTPDTGVEHVLAFDFKRCWFGTTFLYHIITFYLKRKKIWRRSSIYRNDATTRDLLVSLLLLLLLLDLHKTTVDLIANLDGSSFEINNEYACNYKRFYGKGFTVNESLKKAYQVEFSILKQSTVLAYMDIFYTWESIFIVYSIVFLSERKNKIDPADAMH